MTQWFGGETHGKQHEHHHDHHECEELVHALRGEIAVLLDEIKFLRTLIVPPTHSRLSSIKVILSGGNTMPVGPLTISVGQKYVATVVGFDQNGSSFSGPIPAPTFSDDNTAVATTDPTAGTGSGLSAGIDNITASLTSAEGLALSDTETLTVTAVVPVLSSIKISLDPA